eukprot:Lankesteria_metandrocarpae@DN5365_c0_g1_i1.p1
MLNEMSAAEGERRRIAPACCDPLPEETGPAAQLSLQGTTTNHNSVIRHEAKLEANSQQSSSPNTGLSVGCTPPRHHNMGRHQQPQHLQGSPSQGSAANTPIVAAGGADSGNNNSASGSLSGGSPVGSSQEHQMMVQPEAISPTVQQSQQSPPGPMSPPLGSGMLHGPQPPGLGGSSPYALQGRMGMPSMPRASAMVKGTMMQPPGGPGGYHPSLHALGVAYHPSLHGMPPGMGLPPGPFGPAGLMTAPPGGDKSLPDPVRKYCVGCGEIVDFASGRNHRACRQRLCGRIVCMSCYDHAMEKGVSLFHLDSGLCAVCEYQQKKRPGGSISYWHSTFHDQEDLEFVRTLRDGLPTVNGLFLEVYGQRQACWRRRVGGIRKHYSFKQHGGYFESRLQSIFQQRDCPSTAAASSMISSHAASHSLPTYITSGGGSGYQFAGGHPGGPPGLPYVSGPHVGVGGHHTGLSPRSYPQMPPPLPYGILNSQLDGGNPLRMWGPRGGYDSLQMGVPGPMPPNYGTPGRAMPGPMPGMPGSFGSPVGGAPGGGPGQKLMGDYSLGGVVGGLSLNGEVPGRTDIKVEAGSMHGPGHDSTVGDVEHPRMSMNGGILGGPGNVMKDKGEDEQHVVDRSGIDPKVKRRRTNASAARSGEEFSPSTGDDVSYHDDGSLAAAGGGVAAGDGQEYSNSADEADEANRGAKLGDAAHVAAAPHGDVQHLPGVPGGGTGGNDEPRCAMCCNFMSDRQQFGILACQAEHCGRIFCVQCVNEGRNAGIAMFHTNTQMCIICTFQNKMTRLGKKAYMPQIWHFDFSAERELDVDFLRHLTKALPKADGVWLDLDSLVWRTPTQAFVFGSHGGFLEARWAAIQEVAFIDNNYAASGRPAAGAGGVADEPVEAGGVVHTAAPTQVQTSTQQQVEPPLQPPGDNRAANAVEGDSAATAANRSTAADSSSTDDVARTIASDNTGVDGMIDTTDQSPMGSAVDLGGGEVKADQFQLGEDSTGAAAGSARADDNSNVIVATATEGAVVAHHYSDSSSGPMVFQSNSDNATAALGGGVADSQHMTVGGDTVVVGGVNSNHTAGHDIISVGKIDNRTGGIVGTSLHEPGSTTSRSSLAADVGSSSVGAE